jgi:pilus assembly protein Flp/PilA
MRRASRYLANAIASDRGATAVEYALIVGAIVIVLAVAIGAFSGALGSIIDAVTGQLQSNTPG